MAGSAGATHDVVDDREGRTHSSVGHGRLAIEAPSDPHREVKAKFAERLAGVLARGLADYCYDHLILAAAPVTLGICASPSAIKCWRRLLAKLTRI
jgi:protein required for attachment to host cells